MTNSERKRIEKEARSGVDSFHLGEFPWGVIADDPPNELTLTFEDSVLDESTGERIARRCIISATERWGLPNWFDSDLVLALMKLTQEQTKWTTRLLRFSLYRVAKELRLQQHCGEVTRRLQEGVLRLKATNYEFQNGWRKETGEWKSTDAFSLIDNAHLTNTKEFYDPDEEQVIKWNDIVVDSMREESRRFDWEFYLALGKPTDKRLYRFLDKRWGYMTGLSYSVSDFCTNKLGLKKGQEAFKYKQTLFKSLERLRERGFPVEVAFEGRGENLRVMLKKTQKGHLRTVSKEIALVSMTKTSKQPADNSTTNPLVERLIKFGVSRSDAADAVKRFDAERIVTDIEHVEFQVKANRVKESATGLLVTMLKSDEPWGRPQGFESSFERERTKKRIAEREQRERQTKAAEEIRTREAEARELVLFHEFMASLSHEEEAALDERAKHVFYLGEKYRDALKRGQSQEIAKARQAAIFSVWRSERQAMKKQECTTVKVQQSSLF